MVATVAEVREHAPMITRPTMPFLSRRKKSGAIRNSRPSRRPVSLTEFANRAVPLEKRIEERYQEMNAHAERYWKDYPFARTVDQSPTFHVDHGAFVAYVENLPFYGQPG